VAVEAMSGRETALRANTALLETKTDGSGGHVDRHLAELGCEPAAISTYRLGIALLVARDPEAARLEGLRDAFHPGPRLTTPVIGE
jgi:hypothetical protein